MHNADLARIWDFQDPDTCISWNRNCLWMLQVYVRWKSMARKMDGSMETSRIQNDEIAIQGFKHCPTKQREDQINRTRRLPER